MFPPAVPSHNTVYRGTLSPRAVTTVGRRVVPIAYRKADREEEDAAWKRDRRAFNRSPASRAAVNLSFSIRRLVP